MTPEELRQLASTEAAKRAAVPHQINVCTATACQASGSEQIKNNLTAEVKARGLTKGEPLRDSVAAISCGIYRGTPVLDLDYLEDVEAHTDANFVLTGSGKFVEIQGTAEQVPFSRDELAALMALAESGISQLTEMQKVAIGG